MRRSGPARNQKLPERQSHGLIPNLCPQWRLHASTCSDHYEQNWTSLGIDRVARNPNIQTSRTRRPETRHEWVWSVKQQYLRCIKKEKADRRWAGETKLNKAQALGEKAPERAKLGAKQHAESLGIFQWTVYIQKQVKIARSRIIQLKRLLLLPSPTPSAEPKQAKPLGLPNSAIAASGRNCFLKWRCPVESVCKWHT